jgi:hypothetical protein
MKLKYMALMYPSPYIGETPGLHHFPFKYLQILEPYSFDIAPSLNAPSFEETLIVLIKYRDIAEITINNINETINNIINYNYFLFIKWLP